MSYPHYTPPGTQPPPTSTTYPYGAYHPTGVYGQQSPAGYPNPYSQGYQTGITGYGWPAYQYSYHPQQQAVRPQQAAPLHTTPIPTATPQRPTFTSYTPSYLSRDNTTASSGGATGRGSRRQQSSFKGLFSKELKNLMYGFGDDRNPSNDSVNVMEEILVEFITDVCQTAGAPTRKARLSIEDLRRALSRPADAKKLARMEELLFMQEDIKRARAQFEESDIHQTKEF